MPRAIWTLSWSAVAQTYTQTDPGGEAHPLQPDSPAWFAWLAEVASFAFYGQAGSFTTRQEAVQRGERYWYAYRCTDHKLHKKYLGKTPELTFARLEQVAKQLQPEQPQRSPFFDAIPIVGSSALPVLNHCTHLPGNQ
jgi:LuxR family maltose regulon positive regulatory protein